MIITVCEKCWIGSLGLGPHLVQNHSFLFKSIRCTDTSVPKTLKSNTLYISRFKSACSAGYISYELRYVSKITKDII
jgi:hypothetical protein